MHTTSGKHGAIDLLMCTLSLFCLTRLHILLVDTCFSNCYISLFNANCVTTPFSVSQEYDPNLAAGTLARAYEHSNAAKEAKKQHMLAELVRQTFTQSCMMSVCSSTYITPSSCYDVKGLGDEAIDIDDEDEDEDDDMGFPNEDDEQPIFSNGTRKDKGSGSGTRSTRAASYGYRDVFGREYQRQRQQQIDSKV